jgi:hypothetical protein
VGIVLDQIPTNTERCEAQPQPAEEPVRAGSIAHSVFRLAPSFLDFVFLAPLGFLIARPTGFQSLLGDGDTGWHIRTGDWMFQNGRIPMADFFSFSKPGGEWFAWEWLWDAAFSFLQKTGGMAAVLLASIIVICFASALVYGITKSKSGNSVVSLFVALIAMCAGSFHWLARPHLFTFLFTAIFFQFLDTGTVRTRRMMITLPLLMVLWTNLHGGFVAGLLITGAYFAGETLRYFCTAGDTRKAAGRNAVLYAKVLGACVAATFVNPYFYKLHQHVISYLTDGYQMKHIGEFQSISFHHPLAVFFEAMLVVGLLTAFWNLMRGNFTAVLLLLGWAHLALVSGRNISLFVIVASPLIAEAVSCWIADLQNHQVEWIRSSATKVNQFFAEINIMERIPRLHLVSAAAIWLAGSLLYAPAPPARFQSNYDVKTFPVLAVDEMQKRHFTSRIFSTDDWSGYVIYRLYPQGKVFLDGRSDYYGPALGEEFSDIMNAKAGWEGHLKKYGVETILLPAKAMLSVAMKGSHQWECIYDDGVAAIYRPPSSEQKVSAALSGGRESGL